MFEDSELTLADVLDDDDLEAMYIEWYEENFEAVISMDSLGLSDSDF
jgi:hypothetical protein